MYLVKGGGYDAAFLGAGFVPEAAALVYTGIVAGVPINIYFAPTVVPAGAH
jgi:hypothetical protein